MAQARWDRRDVRFGVSDQIVFNQYID
jgi:hypothetical protein